MACTGPFYDGSFFVLKMETDKPKNLILSRKEAAQEYLSSKKDNWDSYEKMFHNQLNSKVTDKTKSQVFDPKVATLIIERAYRVMSQNPTGKVKAISKNDAGAEKLMNLILDKYILPNANAQFDLLTKLRMVDIYSNLYGNFFALVDWDVKKNGYTGPDMWLLNIRDVFPQVGAVSLEDSDYVIVRSWQPLSYFESLKKQSGYKNISQIIAKLKDKSNPKKDSDSKSKREEEYPEAEGTPGTGFYEVLTQYSRDTWTDYCVDADLEFREIANPHENGELPVICKYSIPLLDDFMGMGDAERGESMQGVVNSIWNLYLDSVKMSIFPPTLINKDNIAAMSSLKWAASAKWLVRGQINNAVSPIQLTPQGTSTFNNTYQVANAALLNMFGTTDTAVTAQTDVGFGKTPEALKMQGARENTRDNADRFYMEQFVKEMVNRMINLMAKKSDSSVAVRMFEDEIEEMSKEYPDVAEMYDEKTGKLNIESKSFGKALYDYEIVSGSMFLVDQEAQQKNINGLVGMIFGNQMLLQQALQTGYVNVGPVKISVGELMKRSIVNSGIQDWNKIVEEEKPQESAERLFEEANQQFISAVQQMEQGQGQPGQMPPQAQMPPEGVPGGING